MHIETKVIKEYEKQVRKVLKSIINGINKIQIINVYAINIII